MGYTFRGLPVSPVKKDFYCKAGAYEHKWRTGWVAVSDDGKEVLGNFLSPSAQVGAHRFDYPIYRTRKSLVSDLD